MWCKFFFELITNQKVGSSHIFLGQQELMSFKKINEFEYGPKNLL